MTTIRESYQALKDINKAMDKMDLAPCTIRAEVRWPSHWPCNRTSSLSDFERFVEEKVDNKEIKDYILKNLDNINITWTKEYDYEESVIKGQSDYISTNINGHSVCFEITLEYNIV